ncbi:hypothetical protein [Achromobacter sp. UMC46]|uniref:hypothetical protein n=1 Tax=Achromobacter sp. UMC46 TaxID=1862319 RepID=UPI001602179D|nr:hypothetical protein [Achromobacter sp. UMC46]MBB1594294.1 hypothetical protein [Achromobacter sp. UMC46]
MNDKTKTWRSSTTTRSWSSTTDLTPEQRVNIEELLDGKLDGVTVSQEWSYSGLENGEVFKVEIKDGAVTVNGRKYDSLDEVPRAERERIDALRSGKDLGGLWDMLTNAGIDVKDLAGDLAGHKNKPAFTIETDSPDRDSANPVRTAPVDDAAVRMAAGDPSLSPGAVRAGGGLRRTLLIGIAIGLALWVAQALNLF